MKRGIRCIVETTETAEFDRIIHRVPDDTLRRIAADIAAAPYREGDRHEGSLRIRSLAGLDVVFALYPAPEGLVATIFTFRPSQSPRSTDMILKALGWLSTIRGALGL